MTWCPQDSTTDSKMPLRSLLKCRTRAWKSSIHRWNSGLARFSATKTSSVVYLLKFSQTSKIGKIFNIINKDKIKMIVKNLITCKQLSNLKGFKIHRVTITIYTTIQIKIVQASDQQRGQWAMPTCQCFASGRNTIPSREWKRVRSAMMSTTRRGITAI